MDTDTKMQFELGIFQKSESFAGRLNTFESCLNCYNIVSCFTAVAGVQAYSRGTS